MRKHTSFLLILATILLAGCGTLSSSNTTKLTQFSTIDALLAAQYDGDWELNNVENYGNFGIGTYNSLDGEMLIIDGKFYQVKSDGKVYSPDTTQKTPFVCITDFQPTASDSLKNMDFTGFEKHFSAKKWNENLPYAVKITGTFSTVQTRSVPRQQKPYPPLVEVAKTQPVFNIEKCQGTLIGFYCPKYLKGLNVPGWHLHFLDESKQKGGHVLKFELTQGKAEYMVCDQINMILPTDTGFQNIDLSKDRSKELHKVEK